MVHKTHFLLEFEKLDRGFVEKAENMIIRLIVLIVKILLFMIILIVKFDK